MKKLLFFVMAGFAVLVLTKCGSSKKAAVTKPKLSYDANLSSVIISHCSPCHIPEKGGKKKAYDNYANVQQDIDEILRRIQLNPSERGFMPFKKAKLADDTIALFKQWKEDGMLEK